MSYVAKLLPASLVTGLLLAAAGIIPLGAHAQLNIGTGLDEVAGETGLSDEGIGVIVGRIINIFLGLLGLIFLVLILYAGFLWMTAGGNPEKVEKAKKLIVQAIIGLIIVLAAYAISNFVVTSLTGPGGVGL